MPFQTDEQLRNRRDMLTRSAANRLQHPLHCTCGAGDIFPNQAEVSADGDLLCPNCKIILFAAVTETPITVPAAPATMPSEREIMAALPPRGTAAYTRLVTEALRFTVRVAANATAAEGIEALILQHGQMRQSALDLVMRAINGDGGEGAHS